MEGITVLEVRILPVKMNNGLIKNIKLLEKIIIDVKKDIIKLVVIKIKQIYYELAISINLF